MARKKAKLKPPRGPRTGKPRRQTDFEKRHAEGKAKEERKRKSKRLNDKDVKNPSEDFKKAKAAERRVESIKKKNAAHTSKMKRKEAVQRGGKDTGKVGIGRRGRKLTSKLPVREDRRKDGSVTKTGRRKAHEVGGKKSLGTVKVSKAERAKAKRNRDLSKEKAKKLPKQKTVKDMPERKAKGKRKPATKPATRSSKKKLGKSLNPKGKFTSIAILEGGKPQDSLTAKQRGARSGVTGSRRKTVGSVARRAIGALGKTLRKKKR